MFFGADIEAEGELECFQIDGTMQMEIHELLGIGEEERW